VCFRGYCENGERRPGSGEDDASSRDAGGGDADTPLDAGLDAGPADAHPSPIVDIDFTRLPLPSSVTFTRASAGTYIDEIGRIATAALNVPRLDHDPSTLAASGLLIEPTATNLCTVSDALDQSPWMASLSTVTRTSTLAPDGATRASRIAATAAVGDHAVIRPLTLARNATYAFSIYLRAEEWATAALEVSGYDDGIGGQEFDLTSGALLDAHWGSTVVAAESRVLSGGWIRARVVFNTRDGAQSQVRLMVSTGESAGDPSRGFDAWGCQVELGSETSSYIPAPSSVSAMRAADHLALNDLDWLRAESFTIAIKQSRLFPQSTRPSPLFSLSSSSTGDGLMLDSFPEGEGVRVIVAGRQQADLRVLGAAWRPDQVHVFALGYGPTIAIANGVATNSSPVAPPRLRAVDRAEIASRAPSDALGGHLRALAIYGVAFDLLDLQLLAIP
jgi:hypothetical protein